MIIDKLSKKISIGDKVAYQSFKLNGLSYGEVIELKRTRAVIKSIKLDYAGISGVTDYRDGVITESVSGYDIIKL